jgi:NADH-quinone oxidoreductase subunit J
MQDILFWSFASIALIAALLVIVAKNPVRAVLSLIITFCATAATWLTMDAEFLGITLILVYVGAVMVLFLFVIMMLDIKVASLTAKFSNWLPVGVLLAITLFMSIIGIIYKVHIAPTQNTLELAYGSGVSNTALLGNLVFTQYLLQFEIAGVLLLVAIIAAISLIYRGPRARKVQNIADQIKVKAKDRLRLVDGA